MSQNSARITLGLAALTCGACASFFFLTSGSAKVVSASASKAPAGNTLPAAIADAIPERSLGWEPVARQDDDLWAYDLFTPVEVSWNPSASAYEPKGLPKGPEVPFGLKLTSLTHPKYRYRLAALIEGKDAKETLIKFNDDLSRDILSAKIGQTVGPDDGKITVLSFENKTVKGADNLLRRDTFIRVKDHKLNKTLEVRRDPLLFADTVEATFSTDSAPDVVWKAAAVGAKYENDAGSYVIKGIDFDAQSVTVEKTWTETVPKTVVKNTVETLTVSRPSAPTTTAIKPSQK